MSKIFHNVLVLWLSSRQLVSEMNLETLCVSEHIKNPLIFNETGGKFLTFFGLFSIWKTIKQQ